MASIPSDSQAFIIRNGIEEQRARSEQLEKDISEALKVKAQETMERLVAERAEFSADGPASTTTFDTKQFSFCSNSITATLDAISCRVNRSRICLSLSLYQHMAHQRRHDNK